MTMPIIPSSLSLLSPKAYPVYGTHVEFEWKNQGNNKSNKKYKNSTISVVYAIPSPRKGANNGGNFVIHSSSSSSTTTSTSATTATTSITVNGIVILLHACTHNAFKFFSPSTTKCPDCVGLSEELQLVRHVLERGYVALAVTCSNAKSGCWGDGEDVDRIRYVVDEFIRRHSIHHSIITSTTNNSAAADNNSDNTRSNNNDKVGVTVYAIGASSGGYMAAKIMAEGIANSAAVMVMGLGEQLLNKLLSLNKPQTASTTNDAAAASTTRRRLYFAPMTKDKGTAKRVRENYKYLIEQQKSSSQKPFEVILDETSCLPLPVTVEYLWNRVPGMTKEASKIIVDTLLEQKHLDPANNLLIVNPTKSNWRDYLLALPHPAAAAYTKKEKNGSTNNNKMLLWETFDLTPGISPLAKALHRAWAMHEYCSESVIPAIDFFEKE